MSVKKKFLSVTASLLLLTMLTLPAGAVSVDVTDPDAMLPVDIILDQENKEIRKVYDLSPNTDPSTLPMGQFERDGLLYECTDVLREVIIGSETQVITQEETVDSKKKDMDTILSLLPQEKEVTTEEGFTGTLTLDLDSIKTEAAGYGSSTQPVTATRTYPNLANQDLNHLPKSITEGGRTLQLQDVQWQTDNTYNADDYEIGDRFTAVCTYGGSKTVSYVTGYPATYPSQIFFLKEDIGYEIVVLYDGEQHLARLLQPQEDLRYIFVLPHIRMAQELVLPNVPCLFATVDYNGQEVPNVRFYTESEGGGNGTV